MNKRDEKDFIIENIAMLLDSGMDIITGLHAVRKSVRLKSTRRDLTFIIQQVEAGSPLWRSLEEIKYFSSNVLALIKIGEESGHLPENFRVIVVQQYKDREFRSRLRSAALYPVFMFVLTMVIGLAMAWFVLPSLTRIFLDLNIDLPLPTRILIGIGDILQSYGVFLVPSLIFVILTITYIFFINAKTQYIGRSLLFQVPGIKKLIQQLELARLGYILGTLLHAGLPLLDALKSLADATPFRAYKKMYEFLCKQLNDGHPLRRSLRVYGKGKQLVPPSIQEMIGVGEQSGKLAETLLQFGKVYETKAEITTKNLTILFEPILLVAVWLVVLFVALSVIMPIYGLLGGIN